MSKASAKGYNAAGIPRNAIWFFKQQLAAKPEMFSEANKFNITVLGIVPTVDEQWIKYNPSAANYIDQKLHHHHIDGQETTAAIPKGLHEDNFSELHPYIKAARGARIKGMLGGTLTVLTNFYSLLGAFTGDPDSWINAFGAGIPQVGEIKKDWGGTGLYMQIMSIDVQYTPILDDKGNAILDKVTGKAQQRVSGRTVKANVYSSYIWNDDENKFEGVNKVSENTEQWNYDKDGNRKIQNNENFL